MHLAYQDECGLSLQESQKMKQFLIETTLLLYNAVVGRSKPNLGVTKYNINNYKAHCQTFVFLCVAVILSLTRAIREHINILLHECKR